MILNSYKFFTRDVTYDPMKITGSWALASNPAEARDILLANLGWNPEERKKIRVSFEQQYESCVLKGRSKEFRGERHEWIEAVRRNIVDESTLCFLVPEAIRHCRPKPPPKPTKKELRAAEKRRQRALRTPFLSQLEWALSNHPTLWRALGKFTIYVGVAVFVFNYWQELLTIAVLLLTLFAFVAFL